MNLGSREDEKWVENKWNGNGVVRKRFGEVWLFESWKISSSLYSSSRLREKENQKRPKQQHHQTIQTQVNSTHNSHTRQQPLSIYTKKLLTPAPITVTLTLSATYHNHFFHVFLLCPLFFLNPSRACLLALSGKIKLILFFLLFHFPFVYVDRSLWRHPESWYLWPQQNS